MNKKIGVSDSERWYLGVKDRVILESGGVFIRNKNNIKKIRYWEEIKEGGKFDFLFRADSIWFIERFGVRIEESRFGEFIEYFIGLFFDIDKGFVESLGEIWNRKKWKWEWKWEWEERNILERWKGKFYFKWANRFWIGRKKFLGEWKWFVFGEIFENKIFNIGWKIWFIRV
jgi:hypothetical protein